MWNSLNITKSDSLKIMMKITIELSTYFDELAAYQSEILSLKTELTNAKAEANLANHELAEKHILNDMLTKENNDLKSELENRKDNSILAKNEMLPASVTDRKKKLAKTKQTINPLKALAKGSVNLAKFLTQNKALVQQNNSLKYELAYCKKEKSALDRVNTKLNEELRHLNNKSADQSNQIHIHSSTLLSMTFDDDDDDI